MVGIPERLEGLLPNLVMCSRIHQKHAEKHHMAGDATRLLVVDLNSRFPTDLRPLDVEEAATISVELQVEKK